MPRYPLMSIAFLDSLRELCPRVVGGGVGLIRLSVSAQFHFSSFCRRRKEVLSKDRDRKEGGGGSHAKSDLLAAAALQGVPGGGESRLLHQAKSQRNMTFIVNQIKVSNCKNELIR